MVFNNGRIAICKFMRDYWPEFTTVVLFILWFVFLALAFCGVLPAVNTGTDIDTAWLINYIFVGIFTLWAVVLGIVVYFI